MSGGSFDYLYSEIGENPFSWKSFYGLEEMADYLVMNHVNRPDISKDIRELHAYLVGVSEVAEVRVAPYVKLLKAVEWWASNDYGDDGLESAWKEYLSSKKE